MNMYFRQKIAAILPWAIAASLVLAPAPMLLMLALYRFAQKHPDWQKVYQYLMISVFALDAIGICIAVHVLGVEIIFRTAPSSFVDWIFFPSPFQLLIPLLTMAALTSVGYASADTLLLGAAEKEQQGKYQKITKIDYANKSHVFVAGTTGSGKTTYLLQYIFAAVQYGDDVYILSGKNGTDDPRSLLNVTRRIAARFGRTMYTVSLCDHEPDRRRYNPLEGMTPTEAADALVEISEYTEPHYKSCTSSWLKAVCECLLAAHIPLSLSAICDFYDYDDFVQLLSKLVAAGKITKDQQRGYMKLKGIAEEAALSKSRYVDLLLGDGGWFFGSAGDGSVNASKARKDDAIFFADLDSFKYTDYTRAIGKLFVNDIRHLIATERPTAWRKIIILDELGAYATEQLMPIFAQARSQGYQIIVATQSIADLSAVSETFAERVLENCGQYVVLRLNAAQDAEMMANIIGTAETVETTHKSSGTLLDAGGAGSKKVVREYKVSPDMIKELPPLQAIIYDKQDVEHIKLLEVPFIDL